MHQVFLFCFNNNKNEDDLRAVLVKIYEKSHRIAIILLRPSSQTHLLSPKCQTECWKRDIFFVLYSTLNCCCFSPYFSVSVSLCLCLLFLSTHLMLTMFSISTHCWCCSCCCYYSHVLHLHTPTKRRRQ